VSGTGSEQVVTEIIVDTRGAVKSTADLEIAARALQRTMDATATSIARRTAAEAEAAKSGIAVQDVITATTRGYNAAAKASETYLGRLDPIIFAQNALAKEIANVEMAQLGLDKRRLAGKITEDQLIAGTTMLKGRMVELATASSAVATGTISVTEAMVVLRTEAERNSSAIAKTGAEYDNLRAKFVPLYAESKKYESVLIEIAEAHKLGAISAQEMAAAEVAAQQAFAKAVSPDAEFAKRTAETKAAADALDALRMKYSPLYAESKKYEGVLEEIAEAERRGAISANEMAAAQSAATQAFSKAVSPDAELSKRAADAKAYADSLDALRAKYNPLYAESKKYQGVLEDIAAAEKLGAISATERASAELAAQQAFSRAVSPEADLKKRAADTDAYAASLEALRAKIDPMFRISKQYQAALAEIDAIQSKVGVSTHVYEQAQEDARLVFVGQVDALNKGAKAHEDLDDKVKSGTASAGQLKFATQQLTVQMSQMFSGIATGQPIFITLIQQGHQIADVMWATGTSVKQLTTAVIGMAAAVPAWVYVLVAAGAAITAVAVASESANLRLGRLQLSMRGLRDDFGSMAINADNAAKILAKTTTLSTDAAREITGALGKVMDFHGSRDDMVAFGKDILALSNILGETVPQATKRFTEALELPSKGAADLIGKVKGIDEALVDQLKSMEASGKYGEAFNLLLQKERDAAQGALKPLSDLDAAHRRLSEAFTAAGQNNKSFLEQMGEPFVRALKTIENAIAAVVEKFRQWNEEAYKAGAPTLGEFLLRGVSPMLPGGLVTSYTSSGVGGTGGRAPGAAAGANGMVTISAPGGAQFTVRADLAPAFQGLINDLESSGYLINPNDVSSYRPGATVAGTGQPSMHAGGTAIDINASRNAVGTQGNIPPEIAAALAAKYGFTWGGSFSNRDPMHFGTDVTGTQPAIDASRRILGAGQTAYDTSSVTSRQLEENQRRQETLLASIDVLQKKYNEKAAQIEDPQGAEAAMDILTKQMDQQKELLTSLRGQRTEIMSTQEAAAKSAENANKALVGEVGAQRDLNAAKERMRELGEAAGTGINEAALFRVQGAELAKLTIQFNDNITAIDLQTQAQMRLTPILEKGGIAAEFAANQEKAIEDARKTSLPNTAERTRQIALETEALNAQTLAKRDNQAATSIEKSNEQLDMLRLENSLITATTEQRNREIAVLQKRQELGLKIGDQATDEQQKALNAARAVADMTTQVQINQQAIQELGNIGTQVFDQVGNAITQAFVGGQGAAVNFGNVARAVLTSVLQEVLKLAILNPILNSVVGGANRTTLDQVIGAVGGGGSSSGGGTSQLKDLASTGSSVLSGGSSILQALGYQGLGGQINGLLGGPGTSLFAGTGLGNIGGSVVSFLNAGTGIGATSTSSVAGTEALLGLGPGEATGALGGATIGSFAGGIGGGFALGSLSGSLIQGATNKVGPAPMIGAGIGALAGAGIGAFLGPGGALIGGLIGGLLGGSGGGFIGPHAPSTYSGTQINLDDQGRLTLGLSSNQGTVSNRDSTNDAVNALNAFTSATNIAVTSLGGLTQLGVGTGADKAADLATAFPRLRFTSPNPSVNANIADKSFGSAQELQDAVNRVYQMEAALKDLTTVLANTDAASKVKGWSDRFGTLTVSAADFAATLTDIATFVTQTVPPLLAANDNIGSFATQLKALNDQFNPAIAKAHDLGYKEAELTAARNKSIQTLEDTVNKQYSDMATSLVNRAADAANKFYGASPDVLQAQYLLEFDQAAGKQRDDLSTQLKGIFGDDYANTQAYADQIKLLDTALYFERLNAAAQFNTDLAAQDKAAADAQLQAQQDAASKAAQAIDSLVQYTTGLQTSASSPLSPQDQYALAGRQFNAVAGAAAAGDYNSITQLQGYAQTFLDASRTVYGSGASYVTDFQKVLDALGAVSAIAPDTLTASVMQTEIRTQTAELVDVLAKLQDAVESVTAQLRQNQTQPTRIAS
jgi:trimeric autotransporter adhesin